MPRALVPTGRRLVAPVVALTLGASGCADVSGGRGGRPACSGDCSRSAVIEVENHVGWPFELEALFVGIDDALPWASLPTGESEVAHPLPLRAGARHRVGLSAVFRAPGNGADPCTVRVTLSRSVAVDALPATLRTNVYLRDPTVPFGERPDVRVVVENMRALSEPIRPPAFDDSACRPLEAVEKARCRGKAAVREAEHEHDSLRAFCSREIAQKIDDAAFRVDALRVARLPAADRAVVDGEREATLVRTIESLSADLERCVGDTERWQVDSRESSAECSAVEVWQPRCNRSRPPQRAGTCE